MKAFHLSSKRLLKVDESQVFNPFGTGQWITVDHVSHPMSQGVNKGEDHYHQRGLRVEPRWRNLGWEVKLKRSPVSFFFKLSRRPWSGWMRIYTDIFINASLSLPLVYQLSIHRHFKHSHEHCIEFPCNSHPQSQNTSLILGWKTGYHLNACWSVTHLGAA